MLVVSPNLTTDRVLSIEELRPGEVLRFDSARISPGGKGVNVLRTAREMGFPAHLIALAPGRTGRAVADLLRDEGLDVAAVPVGGEVRAASIILERGGRVTVLNEPGPAVAPVEWMAYERAVEEHLGREGTLVCIGSAPPGTPPEAYGRLVTMARARGARALVDAAEPLLVAALDAGPDLATPNLVEAEGALLGRRVQPVDQGEPDIRDRASEAASALLERGAATAVVTAGGAGIAVATGTKREWLEAPSVAVRNPIGAGDALVAGLAGTLERGRDLDAALRVGLACAGASVESEIPGLVDRHRVHEILDRLPPA
jgi:1-phosphofructokinase family hexose kinase